MAIQAIRNLINQSDKSLFSVKTKLKEETKKKPLRKTPQKRPTTKKATQKRGLFSRR